MSHIARGFTMAMILVGVSCGGDKPGAVPAAANRLQADRVPLTATNAPPPALTMAEPEGELHAEKPEQDPRSPTVKLKLIISPATRATVFWGRKRLGQVKPGRMALEFERPRASGPIDLVVQGEGFLPYHVRLFSDRDEKLAVHLVRPHEASGLLGYRRAAVPPATDP